MKGRFIGVPYFVSALICVSFFCAKYLIEFLIFNNVELDFIRIDRNVYGLHFLEYTILLLIVFFAIKYFFKRINTDRRVVDYSWGKVIVCILLTSILFRISVDPIFRGYEILKIKTIPLTVEYVDLDLVSSSILLMNMCILLPILEELVFRRIALEYFITNESKLLIAGCLFTSLLYGLAHVTFLTIVVTFFLGLVCCLIYVKFGLIYSILFHSMYNFVWYVLHVNSPEYWSLISYLDFGVGYWALIVVSINLILLLSRRFERLVS